MKYLPLLLLLMTRCTPNEQPDKEIEPSPGFAIAIHGGAGNLRKLKLTQEQEQAYLAALDSAIQFGNDILEGGGTALDAVEQTILLLENNPLFNAGKGSVYTHEGTHELDAAIMDGSNQSSGAVTCVRRILHPITAARRVMESGDYVMLAADGAEQFAEKKGLAMVDNSVFDTPHRYEQWQKALDKEKMELDHDADRKASLNDVSRDDKYGTVGCVALDLHGNLAAGTSTGGLNNKRFNRIGDSPVIGAGTYANNATCAISCTGKGEDFIRLVVAHDISSLMAYGGLSLQEAADSVINGKLRAAGGRGGCIAVDHHGHVAFSFTTSGMFRASMGTGLIRQVAIYSED